MPHIIPSTQCSLLRFFTGDFKLFCLQLGKKKAYLIDFSFKFNEIKFCTLLMNWLMWNKIFSCFYNLFRPVNCMHYIKCAVNSSLPTLLWLLQKVCGTLDPCFITTHGIHKEGALQMYFGVIFHETKHNVLAHFTSGAFIRCALSWAVRSHDFACHFLLWRLLSRKTCLAPTLGLTTNLGLGRSWLFSASSINFLT